MSPLSDYPPIPGLYQAPESVLPRLAATLADKGIPCLSVRTEPATVVADWLMLAGQQLGLPQSYGRNLDALYDSLCDPDIFPQKRLGLMLTLPEESKLLLEVLEATVGSWQDSGRQLWVTIQTRPELSLPFFPLCQTPAR